jgi:hypothetical protein
MLILMPELSMAGNNVPVYKLEVLACLSSSSICQSQLFGQPVCLFPTQCWHVEWEELLRNQQVITSSLTNLKKY